MQRHDALLFDRLDGNGPDIFIAIGFEQRLGISAIRLAALDVGSDRVRRQEYDVVPLRLEASRPVMRHATGFQDERDRLKAADETRKLVAGQSLALLDATGGARDGDFKNILREVDGDESMLVHGWAPLVSCEHATLARRCRPSRLTEESIPSLQLLCGLRSQVVDLLTAPNQDPLRVRDDELVASTTWCIEAPNQLLSVPLRVLNGHPILIRSMATMKPTEAGGPLLAIGPHVRNPLQ